MTQPANFRKRILIVEDDVNFQEALQAVLDSSGFETEIAKTGEEGLKIATTDKFDLIISDIRMPKMSGIDLLHALKKTHQTPVLLMTGFSEIKETIEAFEIGASGFLAKPFKKFELLEVMEEIFSRIGSSEIIEEIKATGKGGASSSKSKEPSQGSGKGLAKDAGKTGPVDNDFTSVSIDEFVSGQNIRFDIFLKLGANRYVKIAHCGENISMDRIKIYKSKGVNHLYLKREDFKKYVDFTTKLTSVAANTKTLSTTKKLHLIEHAAEVIMEQYAFDGVNSEGLQNASSIVKSTLAMIEDDPDSRNLLHTLHNHSKILFSHCTGVSVYSVMIAKSLGWTSEGTLTKVSTGGLFHDLGKKEIDKAILDKPRLQYTAEEVKIYEEHPQRGVEILSKIMSISSDILMIVQQHHECANGYGFPGRVDGKEIFPLAKVVGLANAFCNLVIKNPSCQGFPPEEALKRISTVSKDRYDAEHITALKKLFEGL